MGRQITEQDNNRNRKRVELDRRKETRNRLSAVHNETTEEDTEYTVDDGIFNDENTNNVSDKNSIVINFGITNARSLWSKLFSLYDVFTELNMSFIIVSETWFHQCPALARVICDARNSQGLEMINYMRKPEGRKNRGGGVSIIFKKNKVSLKAYNTRRNGHEIVVAKGKFVNSTRPVIIIAVYISTRLKQGEIISFLDTITQIVTKVKTELKDPYIFLGGDFNGANCGRVTENFTDVVLTSSLATRGNSALDLLLSNIDDEIISVEVRAPLCNSSSTSESDHAVVSFQARLKHKHVFSWITEHYRPMKSDQIDSAAHNINNLVWEELLPTFNEDPEAYVQEFHRLLVKVCEIAIPWKKAKKRSTDDPWITEGIRKKTSQRQGVFRREGRSRKWKQLKATTTYMTSKAMESFYRKGVEDMKQPGNLPFKAIKKLKDCESSAPWSITDIDPDLPVDDLLDAAADYFSLISGEFKPLTLDDLPSTYDRPLSPLTVADIEKGLKKIKIPKSYTSIDIPPEVLHQCVPVIASVILPIINRIRSECWWPALWKKEEVTIIPKSSRPTGFEDTRNISCTTIFSKLAESFMVAELDKEVSLSRQQFGGKRGCGTDFLLADLITDTMESIDDPRACASIMSLDFSKAFNRLSHQHCLTELARKGASSRVSSMVYSFLHGRTMKIKHGRNFSTERAMPGGAPQGTKSGNLLYSIAVDDLEGLLLSHDSSLPPHPIADELTNPAPAFPGHVTERNFDLSLNVAEYDSRLKRKQTFLNDSAPHDLLNNWDAEEMEEFFGTPRGWRDQKVCNYMYVDDQNFLERSLASNAASHFSQAKEIKKLHANKLSNKYIEVEAAASSVDMKLNLKKTQLICVTDAKHSNISSYLQIGDQIIESVNEIKILGYWIGSKPGAHSQIASIKKKFAQKSWTVRHLKKARVPCNDLVQIYSSFVRSTIEYASCIYSGFLSISQVNELERLQMLMLGTIFGFNHSYEESLKLARLPTLAQRREVAFLKFISRVLKNDDFREKWLPLATTTEYNLRRENKYEEKTAHCNRLQATPVYRMRKILNTLHREGVELEDRIKQLTENNF